MRKAEERWGSGVVEQLSFDLQNTFPHENGFSSRNLWRMKQWYLFFSTPEAVEKLPRLVVELQNAEIQLLIKLPQVGAELNEDSLPMILGLVPWRHQTDIVTGCESLDEAIFCLKECVTRGWSRQALANTMKSQLYEKQGKAI